MPDVPYGLVVSTNDHEPAGARENDVIVFDPARRGDIGDMVAVWSGTGENEVLEGVGILTRFSPDIIILEPLVGIDPPVRIDACSRIFLREDWRGAAPVVGATP